MSLKKANPGESEFKFGIYGISETYIEKARELCDTIYSPETTAIYVGPIYSAINDEGARIEIFAPMLTDTKPYVGKEPDQIMTKDGMYRNTIDLSRALSLRDAKFVKYYQPTMMPNRCAFLHIFREELISFAENIVETTQTNNGEPIII